MTLRRQSSVPLILVYLVSLIAAACGTSPGQDSSAPTSPAAASIDFSKLEVIDTRVVRLEGKQLLGLSPNGQWLAVYDDRGLCIHDVTTLDEKVCALRGEPMTSIRARAAWSPDSRYVALTEDFEQRFDDSDIWVMAVDGGELQNLTDDGVEGSVLTVRSDMRLSSDYCPTWTHDGLSLVFYRFARDANGAKVLMARIPVSGSQVNELASFDKGIPTCPMLLSQHDRVGVLFSIVSGEEQGIWRLARGRRSKVAEVEMERGLPRSVALVDDDRKIAVVYANPILPAAGRLDVIDLDSAAIAFSVDSPTPKVRDVASSPDGSSMVSLEMAGSFYSLVVRDVTGQYETAFSLEPDVTEVEVPVVNLNRVQWVNNNTIFAFIEGKRGEGILLTLAAD